MKKQKGLGRGLEVLLGSQSQKRTGAGDAAGERTTEMALDDLVSGTYQPRREFPSGSLTELADSIREQGVLQPLIVRPRRAADGAPCEIVAGERRWRAARLAGLDKVPVLVRELDDQSALAVALIENLQREDLNPLDQANSLARLAAEFDLTHGEVAKAVGRARASVTNLLRLLDLQDDVKSMLAAGSLQMGHARALLPLEPQQQLAVARDCAGKGWSVRQVESRVRRQLADRQGDNREPPTTDFQTRWLQAQLSAELGEKFSIRPARDGSYNLKLAFADLAQLEHSLERLQSLLAQVRETAGPRVKGRAN